MEDIVRVRVTRDRLIDASIVSAICVYRSKRAPTCRRTRCRDVLDRIRQTTVDTMHTVRSSQPMRSFPYPPMKCARIRGRRAVQRVCGALSSDRGDLGPPPVHRGRSGPGKCVRHCCPASKPAEQLSDSDPDDPKDCYMDGSVHDALQAWLPFMNLR